MKPSDPKVGRTLQGIGRPPPKIAADGLGPSYARVIRADGGYLPAGTAALLFTQGHAEMAQITTFKGYAGDPPIPKPAEGVAQRRARSRRRASAVSRL